MIKIILYSLLASVIALQASGFPVPKPTKQELVADELARLEGIWVPVFCQLDGTEWSAENVAAMKKLTFKGSNFSHEGSFLGIIVEIDPTLPSKTIDYKSESSAEAYRTQTAIYKLEGDSFIECLSLGGKSRPTEFVSKEGSGHILIKFKRSK